MLSLLPRLGLYRRFFGRSVLSPKRWLTNLSRDPIGPQQFGYIELCIVEDRLFERGRNPLVVAGLFTFLISFLAAAFSSVVFATSRLRLRTVSGVDMVE